MPSSIHQNRSSYLSLAIALNDNCQRKQVHKSKDILGELDVLALIREPVQPPIDGDVRARVHERTCAALNLAIVAFAFVINGDLFHVGFPINFSVCVYVVSDAVPLCAFMKQAAHRALSRLRCRRAQRRR